MDAFTLEGAMGFLASIEQQIQLNQEPSGFATLFIGQYPEQAESLVQDFKPAEVIAAMKNIEGAEMSPILSRQGKKWLDRLWVSVSTALQQTAEETASQTS